MVQLWLQISKLLLQLRWLQVRGQLRRENGGRAMVIGVNTRETDRKSACAAHTHSIHIICSSSYYYNPYGSYYNPYSSYYYGYYNGGSRHVYTPQQGPSAIGTSMIIASCILGVVGTVIVFWFWRQRRNGHKSVGNSSRSRYHRKTHLTVKSYRDQTSSSSGFSTSSSEE